MKLKFGYRFIDVVPFTKKELKKHSDCGEFGQRKGLIKINPNDCPAEQGSTLLHEVMHGVYRFWGQSPGEDLGEEEAVTFLSMGLSTVIFDNPELLGVLHQALTNNVPVVGLKEAA